MGLDDELGSRASRMPVQIVQGARYSNDVMCSVLGKFSQARNYQKSTEYRGGIWDCDPVKERAKSKPTCMDTSNNLTNKIFSLEEMLACYDEESDAEMKVDDDLLSSQNKPAKVSANVSCTELSADLNNKRWRSEEFDKASLLPCNDSEVNRKKSKKTVSFSDTVINLEDSPKSRGITRKYVGLAVTVNEDQVSDLKETDVTVIEDQISDLNGTDVTVIEDHVSDLKGSVYVKKSKHMKNLIMLDSEDVNDISDKMEDNGSVSEKKSTVKESVKVRNWIKLVSQSSENQLSDEQKQVEVTSSKKSISKERHRSLKMESNDCIAEHETILKRSGIIHKLKNEELINRSHLENAIPELFESETKEKADRRAAKKKLKDKLTQDADDLSDIRNIALEIKKTSQSSKKNSPMSVPYNEMDLSKKEVESSSFEKDRKLALKQKENEEHLRNVLLKLFNDDVIAENIKTQVVKLAEQKNKMDVMTEKEKNKNLSNDKQVNFVPIVEHNELGVDKSKEQTSRICKLSEDESQSETRNCAVQKEKVSCLPIYEKPSCKQPIFERNEKMGKDKVIEAIAERTDSTFEEVSPTSYQGEKNLNNSLSSSRSDSCSNWRTECIDVRQKDTTPQNSASLNWRNEYTNSANKTSRVNDHYFKRNQLRKISNEMDVSLMTDYEDDNPVVVVPLNLSTPPDPLSRFKVNTDPESIWDAPEEKTMPSRKNNQIQLQKDSTDLKNGAISEEIQAQVCRKGKTTSIPRFFDNPTQINVDDNFQNKISKDFKHSSSEKHDSASPVKLNDNYRSRSQSRQNGLQRRSFERNYSSSAHWRSPVSATYPVNDVFFIIKIKSHQDGTVEKLKILKEVFFEIKGENIKLSEIIPHPGYQPRKIAYSACSVKMFVRCVFSLSYQIPNWMTALEAFSLGKKFRVNDLMQECEAYFMNYKIPSEQIHQVAVSAKQLQAVEALKSSKFFEKVQNVTSFSDQNIFTPQSCSISCSVLAEPSEFAIPLILEINRGLESCNEVDVKNSVFFRSLTDATCLTGIQLKFLVEDMHSCTELHLVCEVYKNKSKLFSDEIDTKAKSSIKISFEDEIGVRLSEEVVISVFIDNVLLKMLPKLADNEFVSQGKFHTRFESSKTIDRNKLFCIEKLFYTSQA